jgi:hypothetical protein
MPRQARVSRKKKVSPTQQDTFRFEKGVEPAARPVDYNTSVRPQNVDGGAVQGLLDILNLTGQVVKEGAKYKKNVVEPEQRKAGALAKAKGEGLNDDATEAFIEGYEQMAGEGEGYLELESILTEHYKANSGATPEEFMMTQDAAIKQFFAGRTENFITGALPGAIQLQKEYAGQYQREQVAQFEMDRLAKSRQKTDAAITKTLKEGGDAKALRSELNRLHVEGKDVGLQRMDVSEQFINLMGRRAEETGDSSLLDEVSQLPGPDGIRLIDNGKLAETIRTWENRAAQTANDKAKLLTQQKDKAQKELTTKLTTSIASLIDYVGEGSAEPDDRLKAAQEARKLMQSGLANNLLTDEDVRKYEKGLDTVFGADGLYANTTNMRVKIAALSLAETNPEAITATYLESIQDDLTRGDVEQVWKAMQRTHDERKKGGGKKSPQQNRFEELDKVIQKKVAKKDPITDSFLESNGPDKIEEYIVQRTLALETWRAENKKMWPTDIKETRQILNDAADMVKEVFPDDDIITTDTKQTITKDLEELDKMETEEVTKAANRESIVQELSIDIDNN